MNKNFNVGDEVVIVQRLQGNTSGLGDFDYEIDGDVGTIGLIEETKIFPRKKEVSYKVRRVSDSLYMGWFSEKELEYNNKKQSRVFETGASRNANTGKFDYEGFISPSVENSYARYMHENRKMEDGTLRDSDNWQKGIPIKELMKSMARHFYDVWMLHRGYEVEDESGKKVSLEHALNGLKFNVNAYIFDLIKNEKTIKRGE